MEAPPVTDGENGSLQLLHEDMRRAESAAWAALEHVREPAECAARFAEWLELNRELRQYQDQVTAMLLDESRRRLRESACVLSAQIPPPQAHEEFLGHGSVRWVVLEVTPDALEPHLFLARMYSSGGTADGTFDVYSEDWTLFCLLQGLKRVERQGP